MNCVSSQKFPRKCYFLHRQKCMESISLDWETVSIFFPNMSTKKLHCKIFLGPDVEVNTSEKRCFLSNPNQAVLSFPGKVCGGWDAGQWESTWPCMHEAPGMNLTNVAEDSMLFTLWVCVWAHHGMACTWRSGDILQKKLVLLPYESKESKWSHQAWWQVSFSSESFHHPNF